MKFSLAQYLEEREKLIEMALDRRLPPASEPPQELHRAMRYSVLGGGKRLRPILCLAFAEASGGTLEAAMPPALSVEFFHSYTLVHDDLPCMDNDDWRRGKPTCHRKFGVAMAVLVGDALQALAFEVAAEAQAPSPYRAAAYVLELAAAAGSGGVIAGQVADTMTKAKTSVVQVRYVAEHKTAVLFVASCRMGVISAGGPDRLLVCAEEYGRHFGMAFQIADDLHEVRVGGKPADDGMSCLQVWSPQRARQEALRHLGLAQKALTAFPDRARRLALASLADWLGARMGR